MPKWNWKWWWWGGWRTCKGWWREKECKMITNSLVVMWWWFFSVETGKWTHCSISSPCRSSYLTAILLRLFGRSSPNKEFISFFILLYSCCWCCWLFMMISFDHFIEFYYISKCLVHTTPISHWNWIAWIDIKWIFRCSFFSLLASLLHSRPKVKWSVYIRRRTKKNQSNLMFSFDHSRMESSSSTAQHQPSTNWGFSMAEVRW